MRRSQAMAVSKRDIVEHSVLFFIHTHVELTICYCWVCMRELISPMGDDDDGDDSYRVWKFLATDSTICRMHLYVVKHRSQPCMQFQVWICNLKWVRRNFFQTHACATRAQQYSFVIHPILANSTCEITNVTVNTFGTYAHAFRCHSHNELPNFTARQVILQINNYSRWIRSILCRCVCELLLMMVQSFLTRLIITYN